MTRTDRTTTITDTDTDTGAATAPAPDPGGDSAAGAGAVPRRARRRPDPVVIATVVFAMAAATVLVYTPAAQWLADVNQSLVVDRYPGEVANADPAPALQLEEARRYNAALSSGAILAAEANVPQGDGSGGDDIDYDRLLRTPSGVMARIQIPGLHVDLPVYHGTSDETLRRGAGHLEGTSLPVGGEGTHAVITAHRGLPEATLFTDLDRLRVGDRFTITVFGDVLTYRVVETRVVDPADTESVRPEPGRDLLTLVTCTPLGINSHRILVTGERETPVPPAVLADASADAGGAGFPWWLVAYLAALALIAAYGLRVGRRRSTPNGARDEGAAA